ncbi:metallophosphoesterase [Lachnospiraceae bacterium 46-61]
MKVMKKIAFCIFIATAYLYWQNNGIMITKYQYQNSKIPKSFCGYRILQISDLQNKIFGKHHKKLVSIIQKQCPDCIVITGDLLDRNRTNVSSAIELIRQIVNIAPVYYVSGNHEHQSGKYQDLIALLEQCGVFVLENNKQIITKQKESIAILGIKDKSVNSNYQKALSVLTKMEKESIQILLSHRPELLDIYSQYDIDLVLTGHAHGGQIRIPFVGGIFAPHQGFFPKYTNGVHTKNNTTMIISRGLGNSTFPFRINNRIELLVIKLMDKA